MRLTRVEISKDRLLAIPEAERTFFLALAHLFNEINALTKMLYWAASAPDTTEAEDHGRLATMLLLTQLVAGKLSEAWELFTKSFFGASLSKQYEPKLSGEPAEALKRLKKYFGSRNALKTIRNTFAFHYSPKDVDSVLPDTDSPLYLYMDRTSTPNNLFYFAEILMVEALLAILSGHGIKNLEGLVDEIFSVSVWFSQASDGLMDQFLESQPDGSLGAELEEVRLDNLPKLREIYIPWFSDTSDAVEALEGSA